MAKDHRDNLRRPWPIALGAILLGVILIVVSYTPIFVHSEFLHPTLGHVGTALVIAGSLALSVDLWLKREIAEDAFKAAIGYLLPEELRDEMKRIYAHTIICIDHRQRVRLIPLSNDHVRFVNETTRIFQNRGAATEIMSISLAIDEWFVGDERSKILELKYEHKNEIVEFKENENKIQKINGRLEVVLRSADLKPGEKLTIVSRTEEIKERNDESFNQYDYTTKSPEVTVRLEPNTGLDYEVAFGHSKEPHVSVRGTSRLAGTLLPTQYIRIRWWDVETNDSWQKENGHNQTRGGTPKCL